jgi:hypothetical protein
MTNKFSPGYILCPTCRARRFFQDAAWKLICVHCYLKSKNGKAAPALVAPLFIEPDMLRRLTYLAHPDKHAQSQASIIATQFLLSLKKLSNH